MTVDKLLNNLREAAEFEAAQTSVLIETRLTTDGLSVTVRPKNDDVQARSLISWDDLKNDKSNAVITAIQGRLDQFV